MQVLDPSDPKLNDLKLYDKYEIRDLTGRSIRSIEEDASAGKLEWTHTVGRTNKADADAVRRYVETFRRKKSKAS